MTETSIEVSLTASMKTNLTTPKLQQIPCIEYFAQLGLQTVKVLINMGNKVNVMWPSFSEQLGLYIWKINISAWKINGSKLKMYDMVITSFLVNDKDRKSCFFEETFLLANINIDITFGMSFLNLHNVKIDFNN